MKSQIEFTRVNNDVNGNPRYVCHFLELINEEDVKNNPSLMVNATSVLYEVALKKAKQLGGRKFHNKQYGGGIVFQSYNIQDLEKRILAITA